MPSKNHTIEEITDYLLEVLPDEAAERLEEASFGNPALATTIFEVENNLIDDYVRGQLPARERELFETRYLRHPIRRRRVENARVLLPKLDQLKLSPPPRPEKSWRQFLQELFQTRPLVLAAALTFLLAVSFSLYLWSQYIKSRRQTSPSQIAQSVNPQRPPETTPRPLPRRDENESSVKEIAPPPAQPAARPSRTSPLPTLILNAGTGSRTRGMPETTSPLLVVTPENKKIRLLVRMKATDYQGYIVQVRTDAEPGEEIFTPPQKIVPNRQKGVETLTITIPTSSLKNGIFNYRLKLAGIAPTGEEPVPSIPFRLNRR